MFVLRLIANKISPKFTWARENTRKAIKICWASYLIISKIAFHFISLRESERESGMLGRHGEMEGVCVWVCVVNLRGGGQAWHAKRRRKMEARLQIATGQVKESEEGRLIAASCKKYFFSMLPLFLLYINIYICTRCCCLACLWIHIVLFSQAHVSSNFSQFLRGAACHRGRGKAGCLDANQLN